MSTGDKQQMASGQALPSRARSLGSVALMGDPFVVGQDALGNLIAVHPQTYRLLWTPPGWEDMARTLTHGSVEVDCVEFAEGRPLECQWVIRFMSGWRLNDGGAWESCIGVTDWPAFRERTQWCSPEVAVCHAYKHRAAKLPNNPRVGA